MRTADALLEQYLAETRRLALTDAEQAPLWRAYRKAPTPRLRLRLYEANLSKVARLVLKEFPGNAPHLDMIQDAALEVHRALERFDPDRGVPFGAYIHSLVKVQASRTYRQLSTVVKFAHTHGEVEVPTSVEFDADVVGLRVDETPEDLASDAQLRAADLERLQQALEGMDDRERYVFREYALATPRRKLEHIRAELGLSRTLVQSVWSSALAKARSCLVAA